MKVLGEMPGGYICEVGHTELEKFLGQFYGKLKSLKVGQAVDLGRGYDYNEDIVHALDQHREFVDSHQKIIDGINKGITFLRAEEE